MAKRNKLGESQSLQQFNRDADEVETWMLEKMQTASDESYKDPTNLQVSIIIIISDSQKIWQEWNVNSQKIVLYVEKYWRGNIGTWANLDQLEGKILVNELLV